MANRVITDGLRLVGKADAAGVMPTSRKCYYAGASNLGIGDPVKVTGALDADGNPVVAVFTASDTIYGVVTGFTDKLHSDAPYGVANAVSYPLVCTDENAIYQVRATTALAAVDGFGVADIINMNTVNTGSGLSKAVLDSSTLVTSSSSAHVRVIGRVDSPDNEYGANVTLLVMINEKQLASGAGGNGI